MDNLFKALPSELQYHILCIYVGTHVMRNGKLRRRFDGKIQEKIYSSTIYHEQVRFFPKEGNLDHEMKISCFLDKPPCCYKTHRVISLLIFEYECNTRFLIENCNTKELFIWYKFNKEEWNCFLLDDSIILLPFVKHQYPSWEWTDKKKGCIWQKTILYDPLKSENDETYHIESENDDSENDESYHIQFENDESKNDEPNHTESDESENDETFHIESENDVSDYFQSDNDEPNNEIIMYNLEDENNNVEDYLRIHELMITNK